MGTTLPSMSTNEKSYTVFLAGLVSEVQEPQERMAVNSSRNKQRRIVAPVGAEFS